MIGGLTVKGAVWDISILAQSVACTFVSESLEPDLVFWGSLLESERVSGLGL